MSVGSRLRQLGTRRLRSFSAGFNLRSIANLAMWLDASDAATITTDGNGNVSNWQDKSGNARHVSQSTLTGRPAFTAGAQNGKPGLTFDGVDDVLERNSATNIDNCSMFVVMKQLSLDGSEDVPVAIGYGNDLKRCRFLYRPGSLAGNNNVGFALWGAGDFSTGTIPWDTAAFHVYGAIQNATTVIVSRNTTSQVGTFGAVPLTTVQSYWGIGASSIPGFGSYYTNCTMCEVAIFSRAITTDEATIVRNYLKDKWGTP